jgi:hypothetical protein
MALLGKLGIELKKDLMDFDAVGCAIEMGLPVCISAKANLHIDFAHIAVMHTQHCVLRRLLLSKSKQTCECGYDRNRPCSSLLSPVNGGKRAAYGKIPVCEGPCGFII